ncbi:mediator of RNA polymerase II transcription subunit 34-like [Dendronephthya gigantea]|uniref:mediator of RNA polymerase II transcription subunit 34-like n=1 Tax=Dendronephthya gigantea TaxID=151771 RepID=UPI00106DB1D6|nr:mediator of RNA polymerase II transcription subunit 34-like [Dendronephthya gigantea]
MQNNQNFRIFIIFTNNMASFIEPSLLEGEHFSEAIRIVCCFFQVESLHREQVEALKAFLLGKNIFFSAGTGYGKSLVFQAVPLLADLLEEQVVGTSIAIVICPLVSLMLDQVAYLKSLGLNAAAVYQGQNEDVLREIEEGHYAYIYATPESMLSVKRWQKMLRTPYFIEHCVLVAVDEAHCISQWGLPGAKPVPFRKWYGNLGELRALFKDVNFIACTATATISTKSKIFNVLQMNRGNTLEIEVSPDRANLTYAMQYVDNEIPLGDVFDNVIEHVRTEKTRTPRTIIYCQTIKQCAILWRTFKLELEEDFYHIVETT